VRLRAAVKNVVHLALTRLARIEPEREPAVEQPEEFG
jgi:hypothetical protein